MPAVEVPPTSFEEQKMESLRKRVRDHHLALCLQTKERFQEVLAELFFLQNGGNMMDLISWKRKPPAVYYEYVKTHPLELADEKSLTSHPSCTSGKLVDFWSSSGNLLIFQCKWQNPSRLKPLPQQLRTVRVWCRNQPHYLQKA